jgi:hypothetical protein
MAFEKLKPRRVTIYPTSSTSKRVVTLVGKRNGMYVVKMPDDESQLSKWRPSEVDLEDILEPGWYRLVSEIHPKLSTCPMESVT